MEPLRTTPKTQDTPPVEPTGREADPQILSFTLRGQVYQTGPITLKHLRRLRKEFEAMDVTAALAMLPDVSAFMLTMLMEDAGFIPRDRGTWDAKMEWITDQINVRTDLGPVIGTINAAMPLLQTPAAALPEEKNPPVQPEASVQPEAPLRMETSPLTPPTPPTSPTPTPDEAS